MKKMVRVCVGLVACICMLLMGVALPPLTVQAEQAGVYVEPRLTYILHCQASLAISSDGIASVSGIVSGKTGVTNSYVNATLQEKVSNSWVDVESWEKTSDSRSATVAATYQVSRGTYRVVVECSANGETSSATSATKTY